MWWLYALLSSITAALVAIFGKMGLQGVDSTLATALRSIIMAVFMVLAAFAPNGAVAVTLLLIRALFAQMDVPARQSFVMTVVSPEERAAASSVTNVPRSLASAATPLLAGVLLAHSTFGWPLVIAGLVKITYDLVLLALYRDVPEESGAQRTRRHRP